MRWFNGATWTADVSTNGQRYVDPQGVAGTAPSYHQPRARNGMATAAVVCGSIAALISWVPFVVVVGIVLAVLAITFGVIGRKRARTIGTGSGPATAGIITGFIGLLGAAVGIWLSVIIWNAVVAFIEPGRHTAEIDDCRIGATEVDVEATVTNTSTTTRDYTVFLIPTGNGGGSLPPPVSLTDVEPGEARHFTVVIEDFSERQACSIQLQVQGPLPFGLEMDPPND